MKYFHALIRSYIPPRTRKAVSSELKRSLLIAFCLSLTLFSISNGYQLAQALSPQPGISGDVFVSIEDSDFSSIVFPDNPCVSTNWSNGTNHHFTPGTPVTFTAIFKSSNEQCPTQSDPSTDMGRMFNGWTCTDPTFNTGNFNLSVTPSGSGPMTCEGSMARMTSTAIPNDGSAQVSWDPISNPNLNHYVVSWFSPDDYSFGYCTNSTLSSSVICTGLINGLNYIFNPVGYLDAGGSISLGQTNSSTILPPVITTIAPNVGVLVGGETITITGDGFSPISGWTPPTINFDSALCTNVVVVSNTTLTCTVPPHSAGVVDVSVQNSNGGTATALSAYTYGTPPAPSPSPTATPSPTSSPTPTAGPANSNDKPLVYTGIQLGLPVGLATGATLIGLTLLVVRKRVKK